MKILIQFDNLDDMHTDLTTTSFNHKILIQIRNKNDNRRFIIFTIKTCNISNYQQYYYQDEIIL